MQWQPCACGRRGAAELAAVCFPTLSCRVLFRWATGNCGATMVESYHQLWRCEGSKHVSHSGLRLRLQTDCAAGEVVAAFGRVRRLW